MATDTHSFQYFKAGSECTKGTAAKVSQKIRGQVVEGKSWQDKVLWKGLGWGQI